MDVCKVEVGVTTEVEGGGSYVDVGVGVGVGVGVLAPTKSQEPVRTPADSGAKNAKRLLVKSSPP